MPALGTQITQRAFTTGIHLKPLKIYRFEPTVHNICVVRGMERMLVDIYLDQTHLHTSFLISKVN